MARTCTVNLSILTLSAGGRRIFFKLQGQLQGDATKTQSPFFDSIVTSHNCNYDSRQLILVIFRTCQIFTASPRRGNAEGHFAVDAPQVCAASLVLFSLSFVLLTLVGSPDAVAQPWRSLADQELARLRRASGQVAALRPSGAPAGQQLGKVQDSVKNTPGNTKLKEHGVQDWEMQPPQPGDTNWVRKTGARRQDLGLRLLSCSRTSFVSLSDKAWSHILSKMSWGARKEFAP